MDDKKPLHDENDAREPAQLLGSVAPGSVSSDFGVEPDSIKERPPTIGSQTQQKPVRKSSPGWYSFFVALAIFQMLGVLLFLKLMNDTVQLAESGASGTEFIGLLVYFTIVPAVVIVALVNVVGLPILLFKRRPRVMGMVLSILSLLFSLGLVLFGAYTIYQFNFAQSEYKPEYAESSGQGSGEGNKTKTAVSEIAPEHAIRLLKECELRDFYYTGQTEKENGGWGELSSTGVVLMSINGEPYRISVADRVIPELLPIAREAQKTCLELQFWHDGSYEQLQSDGTWK